MICGHLLSADVLHVGPMVYSGLSRRLFFTYLFFLWMTKYFSRTKQIIILAIFYSIAHFESLFAMHVIGGAPDTASQTIPMIWNIDVALMAVVYFSLGYYMKSIWMNVSKKMVNRGIDR